MREDDSNWFSTWEEQLPSPEELMPLSQTLITPDLALAFDIRNPTYNHHRRPHHINNDNFQINRNSNHINGGGSPRQQTTPPQHLPSNSHSPSPGNPCPQQPNSSEIADSGELGSGNAGDEPARTLKRPRLVWTPQLHKRFVDAVAHLGIKNAVPKTIMQLMSVDGLTRENVASHLQKYRLYLKRMQGLPSGSGGGGAGRGAAAALANSADPAMDHLFASSPVPSHFLHPGRSNSDHFLPFVSVPAIPHHHQQQMAVVGHPQLQQQHHRHMGHFGSPPNEHSQHPFLARQSQQFHGMGTRVHSPVTNYVEDKAIAGGRKVLTLFPTGDD